MDDNNCEFSVTLCIVVYEYVGRVLLRRSFHSLSVWIEVDQEMKYIEQLNMLV